MAKAYFLSCSPRRISEMKSEHKKSEKYEAAYFEPDTALFLQQKIDARLLGK